MSENNKERLYEIIRRPLITEKSTLLSSNNQIVFEVSKCTNKAEIKTAIEFLFKVNVKNVATLNQKGKIKIFKGKSGKRKDVKKAIVTLKEGQTLDLAAGV
ncbi:50S ribosomal protein L23 [Candidatus Hepatincolaceae symbiont of Richtersius coronifer]